MADVRKQVCVELCGSDVHLSVDMRFIELVERVYDMNVNVVPVILQNPSHIKVTQLADLYLAWMTNEQVNTLGVKRVDIREDIYQASIEKINRMVGCIQAACLYYRREIDEADFDTLTKGESLPDERVEEPDGKKKSGSKRKPSPKSTKS